VKRKQQKPLKEFRHVPFLQQKMANGRLFHKVELKKYLFHVKEDKTLYWPAVARLVYFQSKHVQAEH